jgi:hypothetical protein
MLYPIELGVLVTVKDTESRVWQKGGDEGARKRWRPPCAGQWRGSLIHDAGIAVCRQVNGIAELWTVDRDFSRFPRLRCRNPLSRGG